MVLFLSLLTLLFTNNPKIKIEDAWARPAGKGMNSALYFEIHNETSEPDTLFKVTSSVADLVQLHETTNENGMMGMKEIKDLIIPAKKIIKFEPGGYHVMLINLKKDLGVGSKIQFTFFFKKAGKVKALAKVKGE